MDLSSAIKKVLSAPAIGFNEYLMDKQIKHDKSLVLAGNPTESQKELLQTKFKNQKIMNWVPLSIMLGVIAVSYSPYTMEYFEQGLDAGHVALNNLKTISENINPDLGLVEKIQTYGSAYWDYAKDIVTSAYESINSKFIATTFTSYVAMRSIMGTAKMPIDLIQQKIDFKDKFKSENKIIDLLKEHSGDDLINKYNNFDLFNSALMFNKYLFKSKITKSNVFEKIKFNSIKLWNALEHNDESNKIKSFNEVITENQDFDKFKEKILNKRSDINESDFDALFPSNKLKDRSKVLMEISENALKAGKQSKLEDETIITTYLILNSNKDLNEKKDYLKQLVPILTEIEKSVDFKNKAKMNDFKKDIKLNLNLSEITSDINENAMRKIDKMSKKDIEKIASRINSPLIKDNCIYRIPEETYYNNELISITERKIDENVLNDFVSSRMIKSSEEKLNQMNNKKYNLFSNKDISDMSVKRENNTIIKLVQKGNDRKYLIDVDLEEKRINNRKNKRKP